MKWSGSYWFVSWMAGLSGSKAKTGPPEVGPVLAMATMSALPGSLTGETGFAFGIRPYAAAIVRSI
ncbi:MAG: hypothetical protein WBA51_05475 [Erythrobacter sp.]